jgi:hypothetical protein
MQVFTYSIFWKFVYRYLNLFITPLLILYILPLILNLDKNLILILPFVLSVYLLYYLNKSYFIFYKLVPFKIELDDEKITCTQFIFKEKKIIIQIKDIESLSGGIFNGRYRGLMKVSDGKNKVSIGFFDRMINAQKLVTLLISKVDIKVYNAVIPKIEELKIKPESKSK